MKKIILYIAWLVLYAVCAGLSFVEDPAPLQAGALTFFSILFFVPPGILLVDSLRSKDRKTVSLLRWISIASLGLTLLFLVANVVSVLGSDALGNELYKLLIFVSVPMICSRYWVLSMFLWACLLCATFWGRKKK